MVFFRFSCCRKKRKALRRIFQGMWLFSKGKQNGFLKITYLKMTALPGLNYLLD
ncbi:MAG TPA: hypothetical protein PKJ42_00090 [Candidatus Goldiibacteriota bacterium]|nr:hypothetical protein [Candidatus Goldiibacteriota bacterium]